MYNMMNILKRKWKLLYKQRVYSFMFHVKFRLYSIPLTIPFCMAVPHGHNPTDMVIISFVIQYNFMCENTAANRRIIAVRSFLSNSHKVNSWKLWGHQAAILSVIRINLCVLQEFYDLIFRSHDYHPLKRVVLCGLCDNATCNLW